MKATKSNNLLIALAAFLVVALGMMSYIIYNQDQVDSDTIMLEKQSSSDDTEAIEKDLNNTDMDEIDKEMVEIDAELKSSSD